MDKDIFALIARDEALKLWQDLAQAQGELLCKGQEENLCRLRATLFNTKTQLLECAVESPTTLRDQEEYLGHFFLGGEKYYFQSIAQTYTEKILVPVPRELYRLQRRQNYRVHIPDSYHAFYNIVLINGATQNIIGPLVDLSSQGCRVLHRGGGPTLNVGDQVTGHLVIGQRSPLEIQGLVRHINSTEDIKTNQTFGIEFMPLTPIMENKLFAITMEIHKEVFRRG